MYLSAERLLVTHVGSLPRSAALTDLLLRQESGETVDREQLNREMDSAVADAVARQGAVAIDIGNDGEQQRVGFHTYIPQRVSGFGGASTRRRPREVEEFPIHAATVARRFPRRSRSNNAPRAIGPVRYMDASQIAREIERFTRTVAAANVSFVEHFMTAPSPGIIATTMHNAYYE